MVGGGQRRVTLVLVTLRLRQSTSITSAAAAVRLVFVIVTCSLQSVIELSVLIDHRQGTGQRSDGCCEVLQIARLAV